MERVMPATSPAQGKKTLLLKLNRQKWLLLMLLPAFLCIIFFNYLPLAGWYIAFPNINWAAVSLTESLLDSSISLRLLKKALIWAI